MDSKKPNPAIPLSKLDENGVSFEVFRSYSDCVYAAYGTKWNGNAAAFNGSLFVAQNGRVRRLTPKECERLMGFPDDYTNIPGCKVTNRYQAIGNSWCVPVVRWIFSRIEDGFRDSSALPDVKPLCLSASERLYLLEGFVPMEDGYINTTAYTSDYAVSNMLDVVECDADERFFLTAAGCKGILRRKAERGAGINPRLEILLKESIAYYEK